MNFIITPQRLFSIVVLSCVSVLFPILISSHEYSISIDVPFDEDIFTMETNEYGQTEINTFEKFFYSEENEPGLPFVPITIAITTERINSTYSGADLQVKIKKCLYDLYSNNSLTYALLGGDDEIIPVRKCYGMVPQLNDHKVIDKYIPTDMYYACFGGNFEWNQNENDVYGELDDNIDFVQNLFVTRVPVYSSSDVNAFVNKIIEYETNPTFNNNMLMSGSNLFGEWKRGTSDAQRMGGTLYSKYIKPYWNGDRFQFYDSYTDFEGGKDFELNAENLTSQLKNGYSFVEMSTHGQQTYWELENGNYNSNNGLSQTNPAQTIITTIACFTNAFDSSTIGTSDLCLSESLIRNPNSGVIAYLGCSRQGWGKSSGLGTSHLYEANFFEKLFGDGIDNKNFGLITAAAKYEMIGNCDTYNSTRWVQFGLNPIGDPEMPIYTEKPDNLDIPEFSLGQFGININLDLDDFRMCLTDAWDYGEGFYAKIENKQSASFSNLPSECIICITKQKYVPKIMNLNIIQNKTFTTNRTFVSDVIAFGSSITTSENPGTVEFTSGSTEIKGSTVILGPGTIIAKGARVAINN